MRLLPDCRVLLIGGAGFIGSHMVKYLGSQGSRVTTLDDLSSGHRDAVLFGDLIVGDFGDQTTLDEVFARGFDAVMHFASLIDVGESVKNPEKYFETNVAKTMNMLDSMVKHGVKKLIFSSTAATYGAPLYFPIDEAHPQNPVNPYGQSKLSVETALKQLDARHGLKSVCLRYFNAAGADPAGELGERHNPETHLIPLVLQVASGKRPSICVFGDDYDTPDGTCIRDYVHVSDLCLAHGLALERLLAGCASDVFNLGNARGYSVKEVIEVAESVTGARIASEYVPRRLGDPARLVADASKAISKLGWTTQYPQLQTMIEHAWKWERQLRR